MSERTRIVIVGAGPVGLVSALRLAGFGIPSVLLEAGEELPRDLRASTFHPPTLDILGELGVAEQLIGMGAIAPTWQIIDLVSGERAEFDLSVLEGDTAHPYRLQCEQYKLAPLLLERVRATGLVDCRMGCRVTEVSQDEAGVTAVAECGGERAEFRGAYLIGADGAHSVVRRTLGLPLEGSTYPSVTILLTTPFRFEEHIPNLAAANYFWGRRDSGSLFLLPDEWRATFYPRPGETDDVALSDQAVQERLHGVVDIDRDYAVRDRRTYRIHQRIVPDYRVGRILLAGDAAHLNAPTGGMGMNGGIHDAFNLTGKLQQVLNGASDTLLDRYTQERRPVAVAEILAQADQNRKRMQVQDPAARQEILRDMQAIASDRGRLRAHLLRTSMIEGLRKSLVAA